MASESWIDEVLNGLTNEDVLIIGIDCHIRLLVLGHDRIEMLSRNGPRIVACPDEAMSAKRKEELAAHLESVGYRVERIGPSFKNDRHSARTDENEDAIG